MIGAVSIAVKGSDRRGVTHRHLAEGAARAAVQEEAQLEVFVQEVGASAAKGVPVVSGGRVEILEERLAESFALPADILRLRGRDSDSRTRFDEGRKHRNLRQKRRTHILLPSGREAVVPLVHGA